MHNKLCNQRNAQRLFCYISMGHKVDKLKARKHLVVLFTLVVLFVVLMPLRATLAPAGKTGSITVNAQNVVRLRPPGVGGTNITAHSYNQNILNGKNGIDFQADARLAKVPLIRVNSYPDNRSTTGLDFFDTRINAILGTGAQPIQECYIGGSVDSHQPTGSSAGPYYNLDGTTDNGTVATNIVYMVKHYMAPPYNLQQQYWEIGNEPNIKIDSLATPQVYSQIFNSVHEALVAAGVRDNVTLMGPVVVSNYPAFRDQNFFDAFMAHSAQEVDIIDYHSFSGSRDDSGLLNIPHYLDNLFNVFRPFDASVSINKVTGDQANADYGDAALLYRMDRVPFTRPNVGTAITEHGGFTKSPTGGNDVHHGIASGLYNLAITHFLLYNPRVRADASFVFDQVCDDQAFGHYNCKNQRDYSWYALYIRNNYTGPFVLEQSTTGNPNKWGNPYLLVTATRDDSYVYVEVINRNTSAPITVPVVLNDITITGQATLYTMADGIYPNASNGRSYPVANNFTYTFPAESATIFQIPIAPPTDFVITATAVSQMVNPGNATTYTVTATPTGGFADDISFSVSGLPPQSTASFDAPTVRGNGKSIMRVSTNRTTPNGDYALTITGSSNGVLHNYEVRLRVATPDFDFVSADSVSVARGSSAALQTAIIPTGGFAGKVNFSVSGLPSGATLEPTTLDSGGGATLVFHIDTTVALGSYPISITASSGNLSYTNKVELTVFK